MTELETQTPGATPDGQADKLLALANGTAEDLLAALPTLDEFDLERLEALERAGKNRKGALGGIIAERDRRDRGEPKASHGQGDNPAAQSEPPPPATGPNYRAMRARDVDLSKITAAVLTMDGYVCPHPSAVAQG